MQLTALYYDSKYTSLITASPLYWLSGVMFLVTSSLFNYRLILSSSTKTSDNLMLIEKYQVDGWFTGTATLTRCVHEPTLQGYDLSSLKIIFTGGECCLGSTVSDFVTKVLGGRMILHTMYGNTEGGMLTYTKIQPKSGRFEVGACGKVHPGVEIKICNDGGGIVPVGTLGDIRIKSLAQTPGYWGRPDLNEKAFDKDDFLLTGDVGFFDEGGNLYLRGRVGDLVNFKGVKISPAEVEDVLMSHEAVLDAAVVAKPHPEDIQHLTAFVVPVPGHTVTVKDLEHFANENLEDRMRLRGGVHFLDVLPRTIIGKIQRKRLRELSENL